MRCFCGYVKDYDMVSGFKSFISFLNYELKVGMNYI